MATEEQIQKPIRFAVYGSLKRSFGNNRVLGDATFLGTHVTEPHYTLHSMGGFPGVRPDGETGIHVEIFETRDPNIVRSVNRLEGYTGVKNHPDNWYNAVTIDTPYGPAEMFVMTEPLSPDSVIPSGVWEGGRWR